MRRKEWALIGAILLIAALAHGINMFHFPYFESDEGTYMAQAWAILHQGQLAPYTYWYDHAPAGWIQIALWELLTGGPRTFGGAVQSGRVLVLFVHLLSVLLIYRITRQVSGRKLPAVAAALLFTLSPSELYFGRRVLLDPFSMLWLLVSVHALLGQRLSLSRVWWGGFALALSILSKEVTVFTLPAMAYLVYWRVDTRRRAIALAGWVTLVASMCSLYVLMAVIKSELFPVGSLLGGTAPHVSLLGSLSFQAGRAKDGGLFQATSSFWLNARVWLRDDPALIGGGSLAAIASVCTIKTRRLPGILGLLTLSMWTFFARGGIVINFYILGLLPLLALNLALSLDLVELALQAV